MSRFVTKESVHVTKLGDDMTSLSRSPMTEHVIDDVSASDKQTEFSENKNDGMHEALLSSADKAMLDVPRENSDTLSLAHTISAPNFPLILNEGEEAPIRILCVDGGGLRGCLSTQILREMETEYRKLIGDDKVTLGNSFDLVVGTSTGGLISLGLSSGLNVDQIDELYDRVANEVFVVRPERWKSYFDNFYWRKSMDGLAYLFENYGLYKIFGEPQRYDTDKLTEICQARLGPETALHRDDDFIDPKTNYRLPHCAVLSVRTDVTSSQPFVFRSYDLDGSEDAFHTIDKVSVRPFAGTSDAKVWEAARATSAAPTYFKAMRVNVKNTECLFVDGGLAANDPSIVAVIEARNKFPNRKIILISVGTGKTRNKLSSMRKRGTLSLLTSTAGAAFSVKEAMNRTVVRNLLNEGEEYFRFNTLLNADETEMSAEELMSEWRNAGKDYVQIESVKNKIKEIVGFLSQISERKKNQ